MDLIITIILVLLISYLLTLLASKINVPKEVALIVSGLVIGFPAIKNTILDPNTQFIFGLGDIALVCLMFLAGLESSWKEMYEERRDSVLIAVFAALVPFLLGFFVFLILGFSLIVSFIIGICMSITAEATKAEVLLELKKLKTKMGSAIMGAGILDDILGLSLFVLVIFLLKRIYPKENILIVVAIVAFFIGILVQKSLGRKHSSLNFFERFLILAIIPFFFVSMGLHFNLNSLMINPFLLIVIITTAMAGKMIGVILTKPFTKFRWKQLYLIGWAMNSRGAVELALALIAFRCRLIPVELYSGLVVMALVTTLMFPFIITRMIKKEPRLMN